MNNGVQTTQHASRLFHEQPRTNLFDKRFYQNTHILVTGEVSFRQSNYTSVQNCDGYHSEILFDCCRLARYSGSVQSLMEG